MTTSSLPAPPSKTIVQTETSEVSKTPTLDYQKNGLAITGAFGLVYQISKDRILQMPKLRFESTDEVRESNQVNRQAFLDEKAIYERLGSHDWTLQCFQLQEMSMQLALANQGNLEE